MSADINSGAQLPQSNVEIGPEFGLLFSNKKFKASTHINYGYGLFNEQNNRYFRLNAAFRYSLHQTVSLFCNTEWNRLLDKNVEGNRINLGVRYYF